jgi:2-dehydro-3-deoxygluconokinase
MTSTADGHDTARVAPTCETRPGADVVTFGEALTVFLAEPGVPLSAATTFRRSVAGAELNLAIGLARLGRRVRWSGRVGEDTHGQLILRTLRAEGVDVSGVLTESAPNGIMVRDCHVSRMVDVTYFRSGSAGSRLRPEGLDLAAIRQARVLAISGVTAALSDTAFEATLAAAEAAREAGVTVVFDPNIRYKLAPIDQQIGGLRRLAALADVLLAAEDEAMVISGIQSADDGLAEWFLAGGCQLAVFKRGAAGAWATDGSDTWHQPAFSVHAVDPVGAGDAFAAGFISSYLDGAPVDVSLRRGAACGALNVAVAGDFEGSPTEAELLRYLAGSDTVYR